MLHVEHAFEHIPSTQSDKQQRIKPWSNGVASRPKFSTCDYLRVRLTRALHFWDSIDNASPHEINLSFSIFTGNPFVSIKWIHTSPVSYNAINLEYSQNAKSAAKFYFKSDNFGCSSSLRLTNSVFSNNCKQVNSNGSRIGNSRFVRLSCHDTWVSYHFASFANSSKA